ncbi:MAG TPA: hypothetical protein VIP05_11260 [Burkholderiaceae bacterium]
MTQGPPHSSRPPPPLVAPVLHGGVRYEQDLRSWRFGGTQPGGYLVAVDAASGARLWMLKVYEVALHEAYGVSTPGRYFRSMALVPGREELEIENEAGARFVVELATRAVRPLGGP